MLLDGKKDDGSVTPFLSKCFAISQFCGSFHITFTLKCCSNPLVVSTFVNVTIDYKFAMLCNTHFAFFFFFMGKKLNLVRLELNRLNFGRFIIIIIIFLYLF